MTDNARELDEIIKFAYEGEVSWTHDQLDGTSMIDEGLQHIEDRKAETKQAILDWHNKQIVAAELDLLNHLMRLANDGTEPDAHRIRLRAIQMQGSAQKRLPKAKLRRTQ